jgi:DNA polymerase bacteriophage-type
LGLVHLDFEIFSEVDVTDVGLYNYSRHPSTKIICAAYKTEGGITKLWRPGDKISKLPDRYVIVAHNAPFEKAIFEEIAISQHGFPPPAGYICTAARAAYKTYPRSLEKVSKAMKLPLQKDTLGRASMLQVTKPRTPSKNNPCVDWFGDKEKMNTTYRYCIQDVNVEEHVYKRTIDLPPFELVVKRIDEEINERGVFVDRELAEAAIDISNQHKKAVDNELFWLTGCRVSSVTKVQQVKAFLEENGLSVDSLDKTGVSDLLLRKDISPKCRRVIELRQQGSLSSIKKYIKILKWVGDDDRLRHLFLYFGASTGRWTGKGPQLHNLPRGIKVDKQEAIALIKARNLKAMKEKYDNPMEVISSCIRETMMASPGHTLIAGDFVGVEFRVLAWLAEDKDLLKLLHKGEDLYVHMAAAIYDVTLEDVTSDQRAIGKMAILGLGYGMGWKTFQAQCLARGIEITEDFAKGVVKAFRRKYPKIVAFWKKMETVMGDTLKFGEERSGNLHMTRNQQNDIAVHLPSGRDMWYIHVLAAQNRWGGDSFSHKTVDSKTKQWARRETYGGMLTENIVQAVARDLLAEAMIRVSEYFNIVLHVHDEIVVEAEKTKDMDLTFNHFCDVMSEVPSWAHGCPIAVDAWTQRRYQKG